MPTIPQSKIPIPKSWDEFEDIVADLYTRLWNDPNTRRYGRSGQAQQGVNIYGCPAPLQGRYAGVQCKRYAEDTLTRKTIEREIVKAEEFTPALAEYTIATTERRDAKIQQAVREISQQRQAAGKFPVHVTFWEELCGLLCHPDNDDLLRKHYYEWLQRFGEPSAHLPIWNIPHTLPSHKLSPHDFERLCLWLVEREGYERAEHLGAVAMQIQRVPVGSGVFGNSSPNLRAKPPFICVLLLVKPLDM